VIKPYSSASFEPLKHAPFAAHPFWVTAYNGDELYAGGDYPNQGPAGEGLTKYANNASVDGQDLVVWYSVGHTHEPAVEQFPVMTRETVGFTLRPAGFFNQNPALDAP
jgi:primary-amine oxidase